MTRHALRPVVLLVALGLAGAAAQAGRPYLDLVATSPTTIAAGGSVQFTLQFQQHQENGSFDNNGPEPSADIGWQHWQFHFYDSHTERLTGLALQVAAAGGPQASQAGAPDAGPGTVHTTTWTLSLPFPQVGSFQVLASAAATQDKTLRRGETVGTRECVGFDHSLQCTGWVFEDRVLEDSAWTETTQATSLPVQVQVVPEPAAPALWALGAGLLAVRRWRRRQARLTGTRRASAHISS